MDAERWQQALECFEKVQRLEPGYRETENLLSQARQQRSTVHAERAKPGERQEGQQQGEQRHLSQRAVSPDSPSIHEPGREVGPERGERSKEVFGAAAAAVAGMGLIATGLVAMLSDQWFILFEVKAVIPILAAMVGSAGLYHRLASNTGRLGRVSFVMVFVGLLVLLVYPLVINLWPDVLIADLSKLGERGLEDLAPADLSWIGSILFIGFWLAFLVISLGFLQLGNITRRARVLPVWCAIVIGGGWLVLPSVPSGAGRIVYGLLWLALTYGMWPLRSGLGSSPDTSKN